MRATLHSVPDRVLLRMRDAWLPLGFIVAVLVAIEGLVAVGVIDGTTLPPPTAVVSTAWTELVQGRLAVELWFTIRRALLGLSWAILTMVPLGAVIGRSRRVSQYVNGLVEVLRPVPTPILLPVAAVVAGYGATPKVVVIAVAASFPILIMTIQGVESVDPFLERSARSLGFTGWELALKVIAPAAAPTIAAGIRTSMSLALLVSTVADMVISFDGLGHYLIAAQLRMQFPRIAAGLFVLAIAAFVLNVLLEFAQRRLLLWHFASTGQ